MTRRCLILLAVLPFALFLPFALQFGTVFSGDHELVGKLGILRALHEGLPPWWTESLDCGTLLLGSTSIPWTIGDTLYFILAPRWAANFSHILDFSLAGAGFFLWRRISRDDPRGSALLGAITYAFSLHPISQLGNGHQVVTSQHAWLPWLLWAADLLADGRVRRFFLLAPWIFFAMAMATYPSTTIVFSLVAAGYLAFRLLDTPRSVANRLGAFVLAGALGLAFAGFIYVPSFAFARHCVLPGTPEFNLPDYAYHLSLPFASLSGLALPYLMGGTFSEEKFWANFLAPHNAGAFHEFVIYSGLVVLALAWGERRMLWRSREARYWLLAAALLLLVALGKWGGLYPLLHQLPVLKNLRGPSRFVAALPLPLACLATLAAGSWVRRNPAARGAWLRGLVMFVIALLAISLLALGGSLAAAKISEANLFHPGLSPGKLPRFLAEYVVPAASTNARIVASLAMLWGLLLVARGTRTAPGMGLLCLLCFADLSLNAGPRLWRPTGTAAYLERSPLTPVLEAATSRGLERYASINHAAPHNLALLNDTSDLVGYKDFVLRWHLELVRKVNSQPIAQYDLYDWTIHNAASPLLRLLRVRAAVSMAPLAPATWVGLGNFGPPQVFVRNAPLPLAWFPVEVAFEPDREKRLERLERQAPAFPALVEDASAVVAPTWAGPVDLARAAPLRYEATLPRPARGLLCTAIGYYPDWRAFADGSEVPVVRVNHAFVGVKLEKPASRVEVRFIPSSHLLGLKVSAGAFLAWLLFSVAVAWRARRRTA